MNKYTLCILSVLQVFVITDSLMTNPPTNSWPPSSRQNVVNRATLCATSSSSSSQAGASGGQQSASGWGSRGGGGVSGIPSKTARESAVNVEWEPMTQLERRIEDGVHYEHIPNNQRHGQGAKQARISGYHAKAATVPGDENDDNLPRVLAVFCGYRYTQDDYSRLQSAEVVE